MMDHSAASWTARPWRRRHYNSWNCQEPFTQQHKTTNSLKMYVVGQ